MFLLQSGCWGETPRCGCPPPGSGWSTPPSTAPWWPPSPFHISSYGTTQLQTSHSNFQRLAFQIFCTKKLAFLHIPSPFPSYCLISFFHLPLFPPTVLSHLLSSPSPYSFLLPHLIPSTSPFPSYSTASPPFFTFPFFPPIASPPFFQLPYFPPTTSPPFFPFPFFPLTASPPFS